MALRTTLPVVAVLALVGCTDRLQPTNDRWSRTGELIAQSGGQGGARYACVTCHGTQGEGNGYDSPRLAGLPTGYLQKQMIDYADGLRPHEVMRDVASFIDTDEAIRVSNYYAAMPPAAFPPAALQPVPASAVALYRNGDPSRGILSCASCHGVEGVGAPGGPPLSGQPAFYLARQLRDWKKGLRRNDGNHVMLIPSQRMTEAEIRGVSLYLSQLPPRPLPQARSGPESSTPAPGRP